MLRFLIAKGLKKMRGAAIRRSVIHATSKVESGSQVYDSTMNKYSFCGYDCGISFASIGSFCSIANHVVIGAPNHPLHWASTSPVFYKDRDSVTRKFLEHAHNSVEFTTIGHDVWIGLGARIRQGVNVGAGAVVGMGAIVTDNVEPYTIVAGVPARPLRLRFEPDLVAALLKSRWWEAVDKLIERAAVYARNSRDFLREIEK